MTGKKHMTHGLYALCMTLTFVNIGGCGEDPKTYENENIVFENISETDTVAAKTNEETDRELSLKEEESSNFGYASPLFGYAYTPYPFYEYYRTPIAVHVPVTPFDGYVDIVHPFYFPLYLDNLIDDDDDGLPFGW